MALCLFESVVSGHHIYKEVWTPRTGEELLVEKEPGNSQQDRHAVVLVKDRATVRHVPRELSSTFWHFLSHVGRII